MLSRSQNYVSPGLNGITNELLKCEELGFVDKLVIVSLFMNVWDEEQIPEGWSMGIIRIYERRLHRDSTPQNPIQNLKSYNQRRS